LTRILAGNSENPQRWEIRKTRRRLWVDDETVGSVRAELESTGQIDQLESTAEIPQLETRQGKDGKERKLPSAPPAAVDRVLGRSSAWTGKQSSGVASVRPRPAAGQEPGRCIARGGHYLSRRAKAA